MIKHLIHSHIIRVGRICLLFFLAPLMLTGQQSGQIIEWVGQYPDADNGKKGGIFEKIGNIILGPRPDILGKPVNIYTENPESLWILSQSNGTIVNLSQHILRQELLHTIYLRLGLT